LQKKTRSILDELSEIRLTKSVTDKGNIVESRGLNVINSCINLINNIRENYDPDVALDLERRLLNSIKAQDTAKFSRGIKRAKK
jgi:hypothetical protein